MSAPHARDDSAGPCTFEEELAALEKAVHDLEDGHLTLEEAIACFENGFAAMKRCYALLRATQKRVESLVGDKDLDGGGASWVDAEGAGEAGAAFTALRSLEIRLARGAGASAPPDEASGEASETPEEGAVASGSENGGGENEDAKDGDPASEEGSSPVRASKRRRAASGSGSEEGSRYAGDFAGDE